METIIKKNSVYFLMMLFLSVVSCDSNGIFDVYKSVSNKGWEQAKNIEFQFPVTDTISKYNLFINLRNNKEYAYSNLFLITEMNFPNNTKIVDTLQYEMADVHGKFLGTGFSDIKENKLFYKENIQFPVSGIYHFKVQQSMRKNGDAVGIPFLQGITDVGFRIEKSNK